jgi:hypothetical protein
MATSPNAPTQLFCVIFGGVGLVLLGVAGWLGHRQYTIMTEWPSVEAEVVKSEVTHHRSQTTDRTSATDMYTAEIVFRYTLNGQEFVTPSTTGYSSSSYPEMKRKVDAYPPGSRHAIRYNPADANDIRFNAGYNLGFFFVPLLLGGMGIVFTGFGVLVLWLPRREISLQCRSCGQTVTRDQNYCPHCAAPVVVRSGPQGGQHGE